MKRKDLVSGVLAVIVITSGLHMLLPFITGSSMPLIVLSGSMHPYMRVGDMVLVESVEPDELGLGDVLTFSIPGETEDIIVTHRIISINNKGDLTFQTKGDANEETDDFTIPSEDVIGKVVFVIPFAGYLPEATKSSSLFFIFVTLPALLLIIGELRNIIRYSNPVKARKDEKIQKKQSRRIKYTTVLSRATAVALLSVIIMLILLLPNSFENQEGILTDGYTIENAGYLSSVYVITPDNPVDRLKIEPWYGVVAAGNASSVVVAEEGMHVQVSSVPYVLPVQWIIMLAEKGVFVPAAGVLVLYMAGVLFVTVPLWYRKSVRGVKKRSLRYRFARFKRDVQRMKIMG